MGRGGQDGRNALCRGVSPGAHAEERDQRSRQEAGEEAGRSKAARLRKSRWVIIIGTFKSFPYRKRFGHSQGGHVWALSFDVSSVPTSLTSLDMFCLDIQVELMLLESLFNFQNKILQ